MRWAYLLLGFVVGLAFAQTVKFPVPQGQTLKATVVSVTDGDTTKVRIGNELQTVRIIGYDAPETTQPFRDKAALYLKTLLEGREVILESDVQALDKYGRRLYHVWLPQVLVGELILLSGLGQLMTILPNVRHQEDNYNCTATTISDTTINATTDAATYATDDATTATIDNATTDDPTNTADGHCLHHPDWKALSPCWV